MSERCSLSDLLVEECACRIHAPKPDPTDMRAFVATSHFPARFNSACDGCGNEMATGDPIARTDTGEYICHLCAL